MKEESEKPGLKLSIRKTKIMASSLITSWQIVGEKMGTVIDFIFLGSKITEDGDCSHEIKRCLLLGRKAMTNLESILKNRDITLPTKVHIVKSMVFPPGLPWWLRHQESACNVEDLGSIPGLGRSPEGGHSNPLQDSCLENPHG